VLCLVFPYDSIIVDNDHLMAIQEGHRIRYGPILRLEWQGRHLRRQIDAPNLAFGTDRHIDVMQRHDVLDHFDAAPSSYRERIQQMVDEPLLLLLILQRYDALSRQ